MSITIFRLSALVTAVLGFAVACATPHVETDYDPETDFTTLESFAWLDPPLREEPGTPAIEDPFVRNSLLDKRVREAVTAGLLARGYRAAGEAAPDFQLRYHAIVRERTRSKTANPPVYGPYYHRGVIYPHAYAGYYGTYVYNEGTLLLDVIDPVEQQIVWRGWATAANANGNFDPNEVEVAVQALLTRFPPNPPPDAGPAER